MVTVAASTEDAHRLLEGGARIDILIAAGNAPGFDVEFAENVESRGITKRIIILTAEPDHLVGFHRNQMLAKPFKDYELLGMVDRYLRDDFLPPMESRSVQQDQTVEARGVVSGASAIVGVGNVAVNADIVGPSHRLLEAMLRPAWPQEKADFLQVLREGKALYDELHGIFGLETIKDTGDNRAGDRADFREQVEANRDLMASTAEVMEAGLAQEAPDGRTIRMGEKAFRVLREGAKAMGKLFAEGYFRELGREAATRVPSLLAQIQEKMHHLHQLIASWIN